MTPTRNAQSLTADMSTSGTEQGATLVTYDCEHGTLQFVCCGKHRPAPFWLNKVRNVREEPTALECSLGCHPRLDWRP